MIKLGEKIAFLSDAEIMQEAAAQLDALSARVMELEEKVSELKHGVEDHLEDAERQKELRFEAEARTLRAEQERDEAYERAGPEKPNKEEE